MHSQLPIAVQIIHLGDMMKSDSAQAVIGRYPLLPRNVECEIPDALVRCAVTRTQQLSLPFLQVSRILIGGLQHVFPLYC